LGMFELKKRCHSSTRENKGKCSERSYKKSYTQVAKRFINKGGSNGKPKEVSFDVWVYEKG